MRKITNLSYIIVFLFIFAPAPVLARHGGVVLGEAADPTQFALPAVTLGTGLFLPDSPFYFLDEAYQNLKLKLTLDPQKRARLGTQIAGERLAELKIMLQRNNPRGIDVALSQLKAAEDLTGKNLREAGAKGDIGKFSQEINETVRSHQAILEKMENQANGSLRLKFKTAREGVRETKLEIEDQLPEGILEKEIENGLEKEIEEKVKDASFSNQQAERARKSLKMNRETTEKMKNQRQKTEEIKKENPRQLPKSEK